MEIIAILSVAAAVIGLIAAFGLAAWIKQADEGNDRMKEIAGYIREGAMAFLKREYRIMAIVIIVIATSERYYSHPVRSWSAAFSGSRILWHERGDSR